MKGSLRQRSPGTWKISVDLGRDPLGKRCRKYLTHRGTKAQAQRRLRELLSTLDRGIALPDGRMLVRDSLVRWMRDQVIPRRRQGTMERYRSALRYIVPMIGQLPLEKLGPAHIQTMEARLLAGGMSPGGVRLVHAVLGGGLKYAMRMELIHRNPAALVSPPPRPRTAGSRPLRTSRRSGKSWPSPRERGHHLTPMLHLIAYTGLRLGEGLGLTWDNVDLERGFVRIDGSLVLSLDLGLIRKPPKTESGRRVVDLDAGPWRSSDTTPRPRWSTGRS